MRALILTSVAAVVLAFGLAPQTASAAWRYHNVYRFDPACHRYVTVSERVWVPEVVVAPPVVVEPAPVIVESAPIVVYPGHYHYYHHYHH